MEVTNCAEFNWKPDGMEFEAEVRIVDLQEWDVILGIQCLAQLGDLKCNYGTNSLQFVAKGGQWSSMKSPS